MSSASALPRTRLTGILLASATFACGTCPAVTIDWVTVGDAGNAADTSPAGFGAVNYEFQISKYEVTIGQYVEFLNAAAKSDPYGLWNPSMASDPLIRGIARSGSSGSYIYSTLEPYYEPYEGAPTPPPPGANSATDRPITYVSWFDAARFANWMHNGQGTGSTETGAYTLNGATSGIAPARNFGAGFYIPTENEWYKAAYYKGSGTNAGYWDFATQSNTAPIGSLDTATSQPNRANYFTSGGSFVAGAGGDNKLTNVGAFTLSPSGYSTFDQSGNVSEWIDISDGSGTDRGIRGGYWGTPSNVSSVGRSVVLATTENNQTGFRLAVPEPSTWVIATSAIAWAASSRWRRAVTLRRGPRPTGPAGCNRERRLRRRP